MEQGGGLAWSPDGHFLVYTGRAGEQEQLYAAPVDPYKKNGIGHPFCVTNFKSLQAPMWPSFTSDGRCLSFILSDENCDIFIMSINLENFTFGEETTPLATDRKMDHSPCWTHDGRGVIFCSLRDDQHDLYLYNLNSKETKRLTWTTEIERWPQHVPNSESISYEVKGVLWKMTPGGGQAVQLTPDSVQICAVHVWSKDGQNIYAITHDSTRSDYKLIRYNPYHKDMRILMKGASRLSTLLISPDGKKIAVTDVNVNFKDLMADIFIYDLETGAKRKICSRYSILPKGRGSWSVDGQLLVFDDFQMNGERIHVAFPVNGEKPIEMQPKASGLVKVSNFEGISPSGDQVLITVEVTESDIWMLEGK